MIDKELMPNRETVERTIGQIENFYSLGCEVS
jgi:hypothetical protein